MDHMTYQMSSELSRLILCSALIGRRPVGFLYSIIDYSVKWIVIHITKVMYKG